MPNVLLTLIFSSLLILSFAGCQTTLPSDSGVPLVSAIETLPKETPLEIEMIAPIEEAIPNTQTLNDPSIFKNDQLSVEKTLLQPNQVGATLLYEIQIRAFRDIPHLTITETLPERLSLIKAKPASTAEGPQLSWHFHDLKAGSNESIFVHLRPELEGDYTIPTTVHIKEAIDLNLFAGQPDLKIQLSGPPSIELNESDTWELIVSNQGSATAKEIQLDALFSNAFDPLSEISFDESHLDVGESLSYSFEAKALRQGFFENQFRANYKHSVPDKEGFASLSTKVVQSNIRVQKMGPEIAYVFKPETYSIQIFNTGDTDLKNIRITDVFADSYSIIDSGKGRVNGNAIGWLIPFLPAGSKQIIQTKMTSSQPGTAQVKTLLKTAKGLEAEDHVSTQWLAVPGVTISITDVKDPITLGESSEYIVQVKNQGEFEPVSGTISIEFSEHLKPIAILNETNGTLSENRILIPQVILEPGKDILLKVSAEGVQAGSARANLKFMADFLVDPVLSQESTNIY